MFGNVSKQLKGYIPSATGVKNFVLTYPLILAAAIAGTGIAYQYAEPGKDGKRDMLSSWQSWVFGLGGVAGVTYILQSLKVKAVKEIVNDKFVQSVMLATAMMIALFDKLIAPLIVADPNGYVAKVFFAGGSLIDKDKAALAKASIGYSSGGAPIAQQTAQVAAQATPALAATGANTPTEGDPLSQIAGSLSQVIEMATQPIGGSVPGGTSGVGYGGYATSLQGLSGVGSAGDRVFGQLVAMNP